MGGEETEHRYSSPQYSIPTIFLFGGSFFSMLQCKMERVLTCAVRLSMFLQLLRKKEQMGLFWTLTVLSYFLLLIFMCCPVTLVHRTSYFSVPLKYIEPTALVPCMGQFWFYSLISASLAFYFAIRRRDALPALFCFVTIN